MTATSFNAVLLPCFQPRIKGYVHSVHASIHVSACKYALCCWNKWRTIPHKNISSYLCHLWSLNASCKLHLCTLCVSIHKVTVFSFMVLKTIKYANPGLSRDSREGISFKHFWSLIQQVATSQHGLLKDQFGGSSCSCILLWRASPQPNTSTPPCFHPGVSLNRVTICTSLS